jgi:amidase
MTSSWEELAADKRTRIASTIPSEWLIRDLPSDDNVFAFPKASGLLSAREIELTESSATDLVAQMAEGKLKSVDVTLAFCKRAALAQQLVRPTILLWQTQRLTSGCRRIVYTSSSPRRLSHRLEI